MPGASVTPTHADRSRRVTLHLGLAKTGTTYLQQQFVAHRDWLAERGVTYPEVGLEFAGHHNLARYFTGHRLEGLSWSSPEKLMREVLQSSPGHVLLSSEEFSGMSRGQMKRLRTAIGDREIEVVVYLRRRSSLCASHWKEEVKHGSCRTFAEELVEQLLGKGAVLRPEDILARVLEVFGKEALRVVVYDNLMSEGRDLFEYFVREVLSLPSDGIDLAATSAYANVSLPEPLVEILRVLNGVQPNRDECAPLGLRTATFDFLQSDPAGHAFLMDIERIYEAEGEDINLDKLDLQWLGRDQEIMQICGSSFLNAASSQEIFCDASPRQMRVLSPDHLFRKIPYSRFEELHRTLTEKCTPKPSLE